MFGNRFFGKRYFGDRYWGPGGSAPPEPEIFLPTAGYKGGDFYGKRKKLIKESNTAAIILFCT
jgi:hypothetical protein